MNCLRSAGVLSLCVFLPALQTCWAQSGLGKIVSRDKPLARLRDAVQTGLLTITNGDLKADIEAYARDLVAIYIPDPVQIPAGAKLNVYRCRPDRTELLPAELPRDEYEALFNWAGHDAIGVLAESIRTALLAGQGIGQDRNSLDVSIKELPLAKRAAAMRYAGALLADIGVSDNTLSPYVAAFRKHQEAALASRLDRVGKSATLPAGQPFVFGPESAEVVRSKIPGAADANVKSVQSFRAGGRNFKTLWVGKSLIVVPQGDRVPASEENPLGIRTPEIGELRVLDMDMRPRDGAGG